MVNTPDDQTVVTFFMATHGAFSFRTRGGGGYLYRLPKGDAAIGQFVCIVYTTCTRVEFTACCTELRHTPHGQQQQAADSSDLVFLEVL